MVGMPRERQDGGGSCAAVPRYRVNAMASRRWGKSIWLSVLAAAVLAGSAAEGAASTRYQARDGTWEVIYPQGWEVVDSRDGRAVAFVAPAVVVAGARLRPSLVVSTLTAPAGTPELLIQQTAAQAVVRGMPGAVLLGQEALTAADGRPVSIRYYSVPGQPGPPLYLVVGIVLRSRLYVLLATTSSALPGYRQQAAVFRELIVSFRGR